MVFCGRPSRACHECRVRRIKCDQVRPGCSQCYRASKICSGYRDPGAVVIRDESKNVARKAHARVEWEKEKPATLKTFNHSASMTRGFPKNFSTCMKVPHYAYPVSLEDRGFCFCFSQYIVADSTLPNGHPDYYSSKTFNTALINEVIRDAITSVGLAALANVTKSEKIMVEARKKLSSVLHYTMAGLQDPKKAQSNTMLRTVMMLWLFEMVTYDPKSSSSLDHLHGAASLVALREARTLEHKELRKVLRVCFATYAKYIQDDEIAPRQIIDWTRIEQSFKDKMEFPACALAHTLWKFITLRTLIKRGELDNPAENLQSLCLIEDELQNWSAQLHFIWAFTTETTSTWTETTFKDQNHIYQNIWISRIWSHFRWIRILVHEAIQQQLALTSQNVASSLQSQSLVILRQMATDICISVPFHLCNYNTQPDNTVPRPEITGSFDMMWPLTVVASSEYVSNDMQIWVMGILEGIGHVMGIQHAFVLLSIVKDRRK